MFAVDPLSLFSLCQDSVKHNTTIHHPSHISLIFNIKITSYVPFYIPLPDNSVCFPLPLSLSISHFCIGHSHLGQLRVTAFLYCQLTPYLSQVDTGIYKRMRWNVEKLRDNELQQKEDEEDRREKEEETVCDTE